MMMVLRSIRSVSARSSLLSPPAAFTAADACSIFFFASSMWPRALATLGTFAGVAAHIRRDIAAAIRTLRNPRLVKILALISMPGCQVRIYFLGGHGFQNGQSFGLVR